MKNKQIIKQNSFTKNIFDRNELQEKSVTEEFSLTANDGKKYKTKHYN